MLGIFGRAAKGITGAGLGIAGNLGRSSITAAKFSENFFLGGRSPIYKSLSGRYTFNETLRKRVFQGAFLMAGVQALSAISNSHDWRIRETDTTWRDSTAGLPLAQYYNNK